MRLVSQGTKDDDRWSTATSHVQ